MRQFIKQGLSAASLIVLLPTIFLAPYAYFIFAILVSCMAAVIMHPLDFLKSHPPSGSAGTWAAPALLLTWVGGYFLSILVYLLLLLPLPRKANFFLWCIPVIYLLEMLLLQPWTGTIVDAVANWAMGTIAILLPLALLGLWLERPRKKKLPPPFPSPSGREDPPSQLLPLSPTLSSM